MPQFDDAGEWITIGGSPGDRGSHQGGFPVKVAADGTIVAGRLGLKGKTVQEAGKALAEKKSAKPDKGDKGDKAGKKVAVKDAARKDAVPETEAVAAARKLAGGGGLKDATEAELRAAHATLRDHWEKLYAASAPANAAAARTPESMDLVRRSVAAGREAQAVKEELLRRGIKLPVKGQPEENDVDTAVHHAARLIEEGAGTAAVDIAAGADLVARMGYDAVQYFNPLSKSARGLSKEAAAELKKEHDALAAEHGAAGAYLIEAAGTALALVAGAGVLSPLLEENPVGRAISRAPALLIAHTLHVAGHVAGVAGDALAGLGHIGSQAKKLAGDWLGALLGGRKKTGPVANAGKFNGDRLADALTSNLAGVLAQFAVGLPSWEVVHKVARRLVKRVQAVCRRHFATPAMRAALGRVQKLYDSVEKGADAAANKGADFADRCAGVRAAAWAGAEPAALRRAVLGLPRQARVALRAEFRLPAGSSPARLVAALVASGRQRRAAAHRAERDSGRAALLAAAPRLAHPAPTVGRSAAYRAACTDAADAAVRDALTFAARLCPPPCPYRVRLGLVPRRRANPAAFTAGDAASHAPAHATMRIALTAAQAACPRRAAAATLRGFAAAAVAACPKLAAAAAWLCKARAGDGVPPDAAAAVAGSLERLYADPVGFAAADPEWAGLVAAPAARVGH